MASAVCVPAPSARGQARIADRAACWRLDVVTISIVCVALLVNLADGRGQHHAQPDEGGVATTRGEPGVLVVAGASSPRARVVQARVVQASGVRVALHRGTP